MRKRLLIVLITFCLLSAGYSSFLEEGVKYFQNNRWDEAISAFKDYLKTNPTDSQVYTYLGICYFKKGNLSFAKSNLEKALSIDSKNGLAELYLGRFYYVEGNFNSALAQYEKAITHLETSKKLAYQDCGNIYYQLAHKELNPLNRQRYLNLSLDNYQKAIREDASDANLYVDIGDVFWELADKESALKYYRKAKDLDPSLPALYNSLGFVYQQSSSLQLAEENYIKAIKLYEEKLKDPLLSFDEKKGYEAELLSCYFGAGVVAIGRGDLEKALYCFTKANKLVPNDPQVYIGLATVYEKKGDKVKAKELLVEALNFAQKQNNTILIKALEDKLKRI